MLSVSSEHSFNHFFDNLTFRFIAFGYPHPARQWKNKQTEYSKYLYLPNLMKVKSLQVIQTMTAVNLKPVHKRTDADCIKCFIWYIIWRMNETVFLSFLWQFDFSFYSIWLSTSSTSMKKQTNRIFKIPLPAKSHEG